MYAFPLTNSTNLTYIKEKKEIKVTILEGDNSSDIDHIVGTSTMIDHPTEKPLGETAAEVATEIIIEEGDTEVNQDHQRDEGIFSGRNTMSRSRSPNRDGDRCYKCKQF